MNGNTIVQVSFAGAHFHGHTKALNNLIRIQPSHVNANDFFLLAYAHQLHASLDLARTKSWGRKMSGYIFHTVHFAYQMPWV